MTVRQSLSMWNESFLYLEFRAVQYITWTEYFSSAYSYSSGGEDGYVRIHYFDPHYFDFELEA